MAAAVGLKLNVKLLKLGEVLFCLHFCCAISNGDGVRLIVYCSLVPLNLLQKYTFISIYQNIFSLFLKIFYNVLLCNVL